MENFPKILPWLSSLLLFVCSLPAQGSIQQISPGCGPLTGVLDLSGSNPVVGGSVRHTFVLPSVPLTGVVLNIGAWNPRFLYLNISGYCLVTAYPHLVVPIDIFNPTPPVTLPIPNDPVFRGARLYDQLVLVWSGGTYVSNGYEITIG